MAGIPDASVGVAIKLASLAVHAQEMLAPGGHDFDRQAIESIIADPEVKDYLDALDRLALLPVRRDAEEKELM